jgi:hypothetical protein
MDSSHNCCLRCVPLHCCRGLPVRTRTCSTGLTAAPLFACSLSRPYNSDNRCLRYVPLHCCRGPPVRTRTYTSGACSSSAAHLASSMTPQRPTSAHPTGGAAARCAANISQTHGPGGSDSASACILYNMVVSAHPHVRTAARC